jgi:hypothetical protein
MFEGFFSKCALIIMAHRYAFQIYLVTLHEENSIDEQTAYIYCH